MKKVARLNPEGHESYQNGKRDFGDRSIGDFYERATLSHQLTHSRKKNNE